MKTTLMILVVSVGIAISQLLLKKGVIDTEIRQIDFSSLLTALQSPYIITAVLIQIFTYIIWLFVLAKADLGYAMGLSGALIYIVLALLGWWLFGERMTPLQWVGLFSISFGVFCLTVKTV
jgi:drug/metabolite transporter (DMT)-like permease